jgi:hypothetical protein
VQYRVIIDVKERDEMHFSLNFGGARSTPSLASTCPHLGAKIYSPSPRMRLCATESY